MSKSLSKIAFYILKSDIKIKTHGESLEEYLS